MAHDLVGAAHPDEAAAEVILEPSILARAKWLATDPLDGAPFVVADVLGQPVTGALSPPRLGGQFLLQARFAPGVDADDRKVAQGTAMIPDLRSVMGAVHQQIRVYHPLLIKIGW